MIVVRRLCNNKENRKVVVRKGKVGWYIMKGKERNVRKYGQKLIVIYIFCLNKIRMKLILLVRRMFFEVMIRIYYRIVVSQGRSSKRVEGSNFNYGFKIFEIKEMRQLERIVVIIKLIFFFLKRKICIYLKVERKNYCR